MACGAGVQELETDLCLPFATYHALFKFKLALATPTCQNKCSRGDSRRGRAEMVSSGSR